jgi:phosphatidate cytidylyltransferase
VKKQLNQYNNITQRILTGVLGAAGIIAGVAYSPWSYFAIFAFITVVTLLEFYKLTGLDGMLPQKTFGTICGLLIFSASFLIEKEHISYRYYFLIFPVVSCVYMIKLYKKFERKPFTNIAFTILGIFYVAMPFALLNIAAFENGDYNYEIMLGCLLILWANDTGAFFVGTLFGKTKLFERISPKKSWEGAVGGAVLGLAFAFGVSQYLVTLALWQWLVVAVLIIIGGDYGDLVESLLKRSVEIKDSGDSLPGHGGFLDRFDGLLISGPFIVAFLEIF